MEHRISDEKEDNLSIGSASLSSMDSLEGEKVSSFSESSQTQQDLRKFHSEAMQQRESRREDGEGKDRQSVEPSPQV